MSAAIRSASNGAASHRANSPGFSAGDAAFDVSASVLRTFDLGQRGIEALRAAFEAHLTGAVAEAVSIIRAARGRVIVTGMGKSGHIGLKIAATLASTGTPAYFVHPGEASHGDLGMITPEDVILALSWSGETAELASIIHHSRRFKVKLIALTGRAESTLARAADVALVLPAVTEACPHGLAPTTSTLIQLAMGDAIAIALLEAKGFSAQDFKTFHPGGSLGGRLKLVSDLMHTGERLPLVTLDEAMSGALVTMSAKSFGCVGVTDSAGKLAGVITDGDLRRHMDGSLLGKRAGEIMTTSPKTIGATALAASALETMNSTRITSLFVVDGGKPVGLIHLHDLLRAGVV